MSHPFGGWGDFSICGYVKKQIWRIWGFQNFQMIPERPLLLENVTIWCPLWSGGVIFSKTIKTAPLQSILTAMEGYCPIIFGEKLKIRYQAQATPTTFRRSQKKLLNKAIKTEMISKSLNCWE